MGLWVLQPWASRRVLVLVWDAADRVAESAVGTWSLVPLWQGASNSAFVLIEKKNVELQGFNHKMEILLLPLAPSTGNAVGIDWT